MLKEFLKSVTPSKILKWRKERYQEKQIKMWENNGCPSPPPHIIKQKTIKAYQNKLGYKTLVETGTYLGTMIESQLDSFDKIISIELDKDLHSKAKDKFKHNSNVKLIQGDSGKVMAEVIKEISEPAIFWLDGHYSAGITAKGDLDCPIFGEIDAILSHKVLNHLILIDDARFFNGQGDYPSVGALTEYLNKKTSRYHLEIKDDIIRYSTTNDNTL